MRCCPLPLAAVILLAFVCAAPVVSGEAADLDAAFAGLAAYDHGKPRDPLFAIESAIAQSSNDPAQRERIAARLAAALTDAKMSKAARQFLCRQLERVGTEAHVPLLAKLLDDADTMEFARRALEAIPGDGASAALRAALPKRKGTALVGLINALGERRDPEAAGLLAERLRGDDADVAIAAARALGKIGTKEAAEALMAVDRRGPPPVRRAAVEAELACAETVAAQGDRKLAGGMYLRLLDSKAARLRAAALTGLVKMQHKAALQFVFGAFPSREPVVRRTAARLRGTS